MEKWAIDSGIEISDATLDGVLDGLQQQVSVLNASLTDALERIDFALRRMNDLFEAMQGIEQY